MVHSTSTLRQSICILRAVQSLSVPTLTWIHTLVSVTVPWRMEELLLLLLCSSSPLPSLRRNQGVSFDANLDRLRAWLLSVFSARHGIAQHGGASTLSSTLGSPDPTRLLALPGRAARPQACDRGGGRDAAISRTAALLIPMSPASSAGARTSRVPSRARLRARQPNETLGSLGRRWAQPARMARTGNCFAEDKTKGKKEKRKKGSSSTAPCQTLIRCTSRL